MFKRRGRAGMIRLGDPFPAKPVPPRPVYRNIIREALNVKDFLSETPQRTYIDAGQHFNLTRARISQLMKIVHELPAPFIEKMRSCDNRDALRAFSGKTLLKIADIKTEKERQRAIDTAFQQIEERKYQIALAEPETLMNMAAKVPWHTRVSVLCPVRHTNILRAIMEMHFSDDSPKAIIPVMVALDKNELAIQSFFKLPVFLNTAFLAAFKNEVTEKEDRIIRFNSFIMPFDNRFIHFLSRLKRPLAIANDIEVRKVIV